MKADESDHTIVHLDLPAKDVEKLGGSTRISSAGRWRNGSPGMEYWTLETVPVAEKR